MKDNLFKYLARGTVAKGHIDKTNKKDYQMLKQGREIIPGQVRSIRSSIDDGLNVFFGIVIVVMANGKKLIIDGQHRLLGILGKIEDDPKYKATVFFIQFPETKDSELFADLWSYFNVGKPQKRADIIKMYMDIIPILKSMHDETRIQFGLKKCDTLIPMQLAVSAWDERFLSVGCRTPMSHSQFEQMMKDLTDKDHEAIVKMLQTFEYAFEKPQAGNLFYRQVNLRVLVRIYAQNLEQFGEEEIRKQWKTKLKPKFGILLPGGQATNQQLKALARGLIDILNLRTLKKKWTINLGEDNGK